MKAQFAMRTIYVIRKCERPEPQGLLLGHSSRLTSNAKSDGTTAQTSFPSSFGVTEQQPHSGDGSGEQRSGHAVPDKNRQPANENEHPHSQTPQHWMIIPWLATAEYDRLRF